MDFCMSMIGYLLGTLKWTFATNRFHGISLSYHFIKAVFLPTLLQFLNNIPFSPWLIPCPRNLHEWKPLFVLSIIISWRESRKTITTSYWREDNAAQFRWFSTNYDCAYISPFTVSWFCRPAVDQWWEILENQNFPPPAGQSACGIGLWMTPWLLSVQLSSHELVISPGYHVITHPYFGKIYSRRNIHILVNKSYVHLSWDPLSYISVMTH